MDNIFKRNLLKRGVVICLAMAIVLASYPQDVFAKENVTLTQSSSTRQNLKYITGTPGDPYLEYTYDENGKSYKVIDSADDDFKNVNSITYVLDSNNIYKEYSTEKVTTLADNSLNIVINENGTISNQTIALDNTNALKSSTNLSSNSVSLYSTTSLSAWSSWTSHKGNTYIKNYTVNAIIAVLTALGLKYCSGITGVIAGSSSIASSLYNINAKYFYYTEYYRCKTLANNVLVIMAEQTKTYTYSDSDHTNYIGLLTYDWSED